MADALDTTNTQYQEVNAFLITKGYASVEHVLEVANQTVTGSDLTKYKLLKATWAIIEKQTNKG